MPAQRRTENVYVRDGRPLLAKVGHLNGDYLPETMRTAVGLLGGIEKSISRGDEVLLKPNYNCACALPLSTDLAFLAAAIEILQDVGARVSVGELTGGGRDWPPQRVFEALEVPKLLRRYSVPLINFAEDEWLEIAVDGLYRRSLRVPRSIYQAEKRVYLCNMRCHSSARYTASLKLSVGWIDESERRRELHADRNLVEHKIADLNLGWQPNLVLLDGRRSTVAWHGRGEYVYPNVVMASGDMVAIDTEAVRILKSYQAENLLDIPLEEIGQLRTAIALGLGCPDYELLERPARSRTEEEGITTVTGQRAVEMIPLVPPASRPC